MLFIVKVVKRNANKYLKTLIVFTACLQRLLYKYSKFVLGGKGAPPPLVPPLAGYGVTDTDGHTKQYREEILSAFVKKLYWYNIL